MTEHRLWMLYCVGGLSYRMIEEFTDWTHDQLKNGIAKWRLERTGVRSLGSEEQLRSALGRAFHVDTYFQDVRDLTEEEVGIACAKIARLHTAVQRLFQDRVERLSIGWEQIDAFMLKSPFVFLVGALKEELDHPHA